MLIQYFHWLNALTMGIRRTILLLLAIPVFTTCMNARSEDVVRDTSITIVSSFNNLFLDSAALEHYLAQHTVPGKFKDQFSNFYKERNYEYAWFDSSGLGEQAGNFINLVNSAVSDLQDSSLYNSALHDMVQRFSSANNRHTPAEILETELTLTAGFFEYAAKMYQGTDSNIADLGWFIPRKKVSLSALLENVLSTKKPAEDLDPALEGYKRLRSFLPFYFQLKSQGNWDSIPMPDKTVHLHERSPILPAVKDRLFRLGELPHNDSTILFDSTLLLAVRSYQHKMGLAVDGAIGKQMISELNVTPTRRIEQILVNLERMRWMPPENDSRYIRVNIPEFKMYVYDSSRLHFSMNVIVGSNANSTVIFSGDLKYVVFSPYWKVPVKIIKNEILPGIRKNPDYLAKHNMEKTGGSDTLPMIRQKPGPGNSLGKVKFLFPNNYDIYFHDTTNKNLFSASTRNFSHGCIRVGEPKKLAQFLLRGDTAWTSRKIDSAMNNTKETWVTLPKAVPVTICYFTAFVDADGVLNFRKDIYKHDEKLAEKLFVRQ